MVQPNTVHTRIITTVKSWRVLRRGAETRHLDDDIWAVYDYLGLSAIVKWPARAPSEVMVILQRQTIFSTDINPSTGATEVKFINRKTWFYSVYEPRRRRHVI